MRSFLLCLALAIVIRGQSVPAIKLSQPSRVVPVDSGFQADHLSIKKWERGYLLGFDLDRSIVMAVDRSGALVLRTFISPREASHVQLYDLSASPNGAFAVAFSGVGTEGQASGFIALLDHSGKTAQLVQIASGAPFLVCFADDGTLWAAVRTHDADLEEAASYDILRHYTIDGKLIGSAVSRKLFRGATFPGETGILSASHDRIGFLAGSTRTWVELSYSGKQLSSAVLPSERAQFVYAFLSPSNEVLIHQQEQVDRSTKTFKSYRLDRPANAFHEIDISAVNQGAPPRLMGTDGAQLVYLASYAPRLLIWTVTEQPATAAK